MWMKYEEIKHIPQFLLNKNVHCGYSIPRPLMAIKSPCSVGFLHHWFLKNELITRMIHAYGRLREKNVLGYLYKTFQLGFK